MKSYNEWLLEQKTVYEYPNAGEGAAPGVKKEIENFNKMPPEDKQDKPLLEFLIGPSTQPYKMSKEDANYVDKTNGSQTCGNCEYAYKQVATGKLICSMMRGEIKSEGWCRLWDE
jgi:hypothetical protein